LTIYVARDSVARSLFVFLVDCGGVHCETRNGVIFAFDSFIGPDARSTKVSYACSFNVFPKLTFEN